MNRNDGAVGDARKRATEAAVGADRDEALDVAAEHIWHNIESGLWWTHKPLADWIAADRARAKAEALQEAAESVPDSGLIITSRDEIAIWLGNRAEATR